MNFSNFIKNRLSNNKVPYNKDLLFYIYDAKLKDVLPIWDAFPLVLITSFTDDGWIGVNCHYVPETIRHRYFSNPGRYESNLIEAAFAVGGIKRYLRSHVWSAIGRLSPPDFPLKAPMMNPIWIRDHLRHREFTAPTEWTY